MLLFCRPAHFRSLPVSKCRTAPPRPRCRHQGWRQSRRRAIAFHLPASQWLLQCARHKSDFWSCAIAASAGRQAGHCHRAFFQNAAPARRHPHCSAQSHRPNDHKARPDKYCSLSPARCRAKRYHRQAVLAAIKNDKERVGEIWVLRRAHPGSYRYGRPGSALRARSNRAAVCHAPPRRPAPANRRRAPCNCARFFPVLRYRPAPAPAEFA